MGRLVCRYEGDGEVVLQVAFGGEITTQQKLTYESEEFAVDFAEDVLVSIEKPKEDEDGDTPG